MRQVITDNGLLRFREVDVPTPGDGQLLVRVHAAGLNAGDSLIKRGTHVAGQSLNAPPHASEAMPMGGEASGEVVAAGPGVALFREGDHVMGLARGAFADFVIVEQARAMRKPHTMSWVEAAATVACFVTAHNALTTAGRLVPGSSVLVNAASGGIGLASLQLARLLGAGPLIASSSSAAKLGMIAAAGVHFDAGVVASDERFAERCIEATGARGVDVVIDSVGGSSLEQNLAVAALGGRIVSVGRLGGKEARIDLDELARKRVSLVGVTFRTRSPEETAGILSATADDILPALDDGRLRVIVDRTFPFEQVVEAMEYRESGAHVGKVVLLVSPTGVG